MFKCRWNLSVEVDCTSRDLKRGQRWVVGLEYFTVTYESGTHTGLLDLSLHEENNWRYLPL